MLKLWQRRIIMGYKTEKLYEDTYLIRDDADEALYLIERNHKAYLIDTGMDHDSLKAKIEKMTDLPITVLLTSSPLSDNLRLSPDSSKRPILMYLSITLP